jgi:hypothetical protein
LPTLDHFANRFDASSTSADRLGWSCNAGPSADVDVTAAAMLEQLDVELNGMGVHVAFAEMRDRLQDLIWRYGLFETLDRDHFYPTLSAALDAIPRESS